LILPCPINLSVEAERFSRPTATTASRIISARVTIRAKPLDPRFGGLVTSMGGWIRHPGAMS
jgi:hypothetical protein